MMDESNDPLPRLQQFGLTSADHLQGRWTLAAARARGLTVGPSAIRCLVTYGLAIVVAAILGLAADELLTDVLGLKWPFATSRDASVWYQGIGTAVFAAWQVKRVTRFAFGWSVHARSAEDRSSFAAAGTELDLRAISRFDSLLQSWTDRRFAEIRTMDSKALALKLKEWLAPWIGGELEACELRSTGLWRLRTRQSALPFDALVVWDSIDASAIEVLWFMAQSADLRHVRRVVICRYPNEPLREIAASRGHELWDESSTLERIEEAWLSRLWKEADAKVSIARRSLRRSRR